MARLLDVDEHPGHIDLGQRFMATANVFETELLPDDTIAPDITINKSALTRGEVKVDEVLVWDTQFFEVLGPFRAAIPDNLESGWFCGMVEDNTILGDNPPTADLAAEGTLPGGQSFGKSNYVWRLENIVGDFQTATGKTSSNNDGLLRYNFWGYIVDGVTWHKILTSGHYHFWFQSVQETGNPDFALGMEARRVEVDFVEALFDRQNILAQISSTLVL